jgi:hypothetical protein
MADFINLRKPLTREVQLSYMLQWERKLDLSPPAMAQLRREIVSLQKDLLHHPSGTP